MRRSDHESAIPTIATSEAGYHPLSFVMVSHPSTGTDAGVQRQVRSHVAYRWHEDSRRRSTRLSRPRPRILAQKARELSEVQEDNMPEFLQTSGQSTLATTDQSEEAPPFISSANDLITLSPSPGLSPGPSPVNYLGDGRRDPFNSCAVRCNTMESFLLDHYFQTFAAKVTAIYTPEESADLQPMDTVREWVSFLITDAGILAGVFLRACRTLSVVTSKQYLDKLALRYRARSIQALSSKIASMTTALSTEAIVMMLMLTTDEFYMGSVETMRYHVNAMQRVVKLKGGLQDTALDRIILRLIDWYLQLNIIKFPHANR
ncbi:hypothetical protein EG329_008049 [Mollisiaceae sp. DMI_Dod_QoI]|nr:hypothetical protein EG329_008049 [Helotiales sp. DMI_Dod_QoI]